MTLKELMLTNVQSNQGAAIFQIGAQTDQKAGSKNESFAFGEILGTKMSRAADRQNEIKRNDSKESAGRKNTEMVYDTADNKPKYVSFREANERNIKAAESEITVPKNSDGNAENRLDEVEENVKKSMGQDNQPSNMLQLFAKVLGLEIKDLQNLLKEADITSESFNNMKNSSENASKLAQLLGLNSEQQDTLATLLQLTAESVDSLTQVQTGAGIEETSPIDAKNADIITEIVENAIAGEMVKTVKTSETPQSSVTAGKQDSLAAETITLESLAAKLNLKIKIKLNEFSSKLDAGQNELKTELKQLMQPLLEKSTVKIQEPLQQVAEANSGDSAEQTATAVLAAVPKTEAAASGEDGNGQEANAKSETETAVQQPLTNPKETQPQATFAVVSPDKMNDAEAIEMASVKTPGTAKEIISQVIQKAAIVLTPEKSEMIMDLKPDNLGKISLKVVTENGIVMAKFIAESQQVRQVLEANMQLLKDSLEKQGMSVQGFSVSVRQDSNQSSRNWEQPENNRSRGINGAAYQSTGIGLNLANAYEAVGKNNPYQWGSSTINLTA